MKRTRKRILSMAMAAALTLCSLPQNTPLPLLKPPFSASAEGKITYDEATKTLTLSGVLTADTLQELREYTAEDEDPMSPYGRYQISSLQKIVAAPGCVFPEDCCEMFWAYSQTEEIDLSNADTSKVTNMRKMFFGCINLKKLDVSSFDTSKVEDMSSMFCFCNSLEKLDVSSFDTSNVTDMSYMFTHCKSLETLDPSNFDTSNVTDMTDMFGACSSLKTLDLSGFDTSNVKFMYSMFTDCWKLQTIYVSDLWNAETAKKSFLETGGQDTSDLHLFNGCSRLKGGSGTEYDKTNINIDYARIDNPPTSPGYLTKKPVQADGVTYDKASGTLTLSGVLTEESVAALRSYTNPSSEKTHQTVPLNKIIAAPGCVFPENCAEMFAYFDNTKEIDLSKADTSKVKNMNAMFSYCENLQTLDISGFDTSNVTNMDSMFFSCSKLQALDVSSFDTSKVTNMRDMFDNCIKIKTLDLSSFDTSKVTDMTRMFDDCNNIETIYVSILWKTDSVTAGDYLFYNCNHLTGGLGTAFDAEHVTAEYARKDYPPRKPGYLTLKVTVTSGKCGENLTWNFDTETGTLTIEGTGGMDQWSAKEETDDGQVDEYAGWKNSEEEVYDYLFFKRYSYITNAPWEDLKPLIQKIVLSEGVAGISPYSFCHCENLKEVILPESLAALAKYAFYCCGTCSFTVYNPEMDFGNNWTISRNPYIEITTVEDWYGTSIEQKYLTGYFAAWDVASAPIFLGSIYGFKDSTAETYAAEWEEVLRMKEFSADKASVYSPTFKPLLRVSFDANGGSGEMEKVILKDKTTYILPECGFTPPSEIKEFAGWDVSGETKQPGDEITLENDVTVKALWANSPIKVSFDANGGTGTMDAINSFTDTEITLPACKFTAPENHIFNGWQISGNTDKTYQPDDKIKSDTDITIIPVWKKNVFIVTFDANGGTGEMAAIKYPDNIDFIFPKSKFTAPQDKEFAGWMIGEALYEIGDTVTLSDDTVIKAIWEDKQKKSIVPSGGKSYGNLNGDDVIDTKDAMLLSRYVNGWDDVEIDLDAADLDGDGEVTVKDAMILSRLVNGWEGYDKYIVDDNP